MTDQEPTQFAELNKLQAMLEENQILHAKELHALQVELAEGGDKTAYDNKRKHSRELHEQVSQTLSKTIEETRESTRRTLADQLLQPDSNHPEDMRHFRAMVELVEQAGQDRAKVEALIHRALAYKDRTLARLLTRTHCGDRDHKTMHMALASIDPTVKATYDFENTWGAYNKDTRPAPKVGWITPEQAKEIWPGGVPGRTRDPFVKREFHDWRKDQ